MAKSDLASIKTRLSLASPRGFCAGVDRAIEIVQTAISHYGPPVYVRHEVVHNRSVVNQLRRSLEVTDGGRESGCCNGHAVTGMGNGRMAVLL